MFEELLFRELGFEDRGLSMICLKEGEGIMSSET